MCLHPRKLPTRDRYVLCSQPPLADKHSCLSLRTFPAQCKFRNIWSGSPDALRRTGQARPRLMEASAVNPPRGTPGRPRTNCNEMDRANPSRVLRLRISFSWLPTSTVDNRTKQNFPTSIEISPQHAKPKPKEVFQIMLQGSFLSLTTLHSTTMQYSLYQEVVCHQQLRRGRNYAWHTLHLSEYLERWSNFPSCRQRACNEELSIIWPRHSQKRPCVALARPRPFLRLGT